MKYALGLILLVSLNANAKTCRVISVSGKVLGSYQAVSCDLVSGPWSGSSAVTVIELDPAPAPAADASDTAKQTRLSQIQALISANPGTLTNNQRDAILIHLLKKELGL